MDVRSLVRHIAANYLNGARDTGTDNIIAKCPFHKGGNERKPSFSISLSTGRWICFTENIGGSIHNLVSRLGLDPGLARGIESVYIPPPADEVNELPIGLLGVFNRCPLNLVAAGFNEVVLQQHNVGFDVRNTRVTWPIFSADKKLVGISGGTAINAKPKYKFYGKEDLADYVDLPKYKFHRKEWLWREDKVGPGPIVVAEGFKACLWLVQHGHSAVATMGTMITEEQIRKLLMLQPNPLYVFLDSDSAGVDATKNLLTKLCSRGAYNFTRVCGYPEGKTQPDNLTGKELDVAISTSIPIASYPF